MRSKYCVYEAVNARAKEIVVGISDLSDVEAIKAQHRRMPPVWITRWRGTDAIEYRLVAEGLSVGEAAALANAHSRSEALKSFTVFVSGLN